MTKYKVTIIDETGTLTEEEKKELEEQIKKNLRGNKMKKLTEAGYQIRPKIKPYQECGVETTTDNKKIITIYGETTNAEVTIYSPIYSPTEELK